ADEQWRKRRDPDREAARDESLTPVHVRQRAADRRCRSRVTRRKRIRPQQQMSYDRRACASEELFEQLEERDCRRGRDQGGGCDLPATASPEPERANDRDADHRSDRSQIRDREEKKVEGRALMIGYPALNGFVERAR